MTQNALAGLIPAEGILHDARPGHAALASDLQEPLRHLMDRVVLELLPTLKPSDFRPADHGPYLVNLNPNAARRAVAAIHAVFAQPCAAGDRGDAYSFLTHLHYSARHLRRHLIDRSFVFQPFVHPPPTTKS